MHENSCMRKKLTPWIVGLIVMIIVFFISFMADKNKNMFWHSKGKGKNVNARMNGKGQKVQTNQNGSFHPIVEMVKPAVVGISLPGAKPFLQNVPPNSFNFRQVNQAKLPSSPVKEEFLQCQNCGVRLELQPGIPKNATCPNCKMAMAYVIKEGQSQNANVQAQAWGNGNTLYSTCPNCGNNVIRQPGVPWRNTACPTCGFSFNCPPLAAAQQQVQPQAWGNGSATSATCPSCGGTVTRSPGIPWTSTSCPSCGFSFNCPAGGAVQQQAWGNGSAISSTCPNCGMQVARSPGVPWTNTFCPNCNFSFNCPLPGVTQQQALGPNGAAGNGSAACPNCGFLLAGWVLGRNILCPNCGSSFNNAQNGGFIQQPVAQQQALQNGLPNALQNNQAQQNAFLQRNIIGSGVIVSKKGHVLTNYHLIQGYKQVNITMFSATGAKVYPGTVVAESPQIDLAVIKINAPDMVAFPSAPIGDSGKADVGSTVLVIGNPFGLSQTVTNGIVSAVRKSVNIGGTQLSNLIQTDAPINQGNSGGPLINDRGEVIGISTAIYSPADTSTGLGFAVPINQAKLSLGEYMDLGPQTIGPKPGVQPQALKKGFKAQATPEDAPSWVGIDFQLLNDALAAELKVPFDRGILVNKVFPNSPAQVAGLARGDVIYSVDGRRITDETKLRTFLAGKKPGDRVRFMIFREGKKIKIELKLAGGQFQASPAALTQKKTDLLKGAEIEAGTADVTTLGLTVDNLTPEVSFAYGLPDGTKGVLISETEGLALVAGIKGGDLILKVDGYPVYDLVTLFKVLKLNCNIYNGVNFELSRKGKIINITVRDTLPNLNPGV